MGGRILAELPGRHELGTRAVGLRPMPRSSRVLARFCSKALCTPRCPRRSWWTRMPSASRTKNVQQALAPAVDRLAALIGQRCDVTLAPQGLSVWQRAQRVLQGSEAWRTFQPWLDGHNPRLAFSVARAL